MKTESTWRYATDDKIEATVGLAELMGDHIRSRQVSMLALPSWSFFTERGIAQVVSDESGKSVEVSAVERDPHVFDRQVRAARGFNRGDGPMRVKRCTNCDVVPYLDSVRTDWDAIYLDLMCPVSAEMSTMVKAVFDRGLLRDRAVLSFVFMTRRTPSYGQYLTNMNSRWCKFWDDVDALDNARRSERRILAGFTGFVNQEAQAAGFTFKGIYVRKYHGQSGCPMAILGFPLVRKKAKTRARATHVEF